MKPINVDPEDVGLHDTDSSELSISIASNSTLPQLEATDAEKAQNEEERRRRRAARRKRREARKKEQEAKASNSSSSELLAAPKMVMMMSPTKCIARRIRKERARRMMITNMTPYPLTILLCL